MATNIDKPLYRVPSMAQIRKVRKNGYKVVSTFSGCGGSCLGFRMAGFNVVWANEFIEAAQKAYQANHSSYLCTDDIRDVKPSQILKQIGMKKGELDVFEGSPPCDSFSMSGRREEHWGKQKEYFGKQQRTDDLTFEWIRLLRGLAPRVFVVENVSGLVRGAAKGYFLRMLEGMKDSGYKVSCRLLDAQWLGVPQGRLRTIFIGVREDLKLEPVHPRPRPYRYSLRDAIGDLAGNGVVGVKTRIGFRKEGWKDGDRPAPTILASTAMRLETKDFDEVDLKDSAIGREWDRLKPGESSDKYFNLVRSHENEPCPTVTGIGGQNRGIASVTHPTQRRKFTIPELKRICSFPDDFELPGSFSEQWARMGLSVPPLMMKAVAETVRDEILKKLDRAK